MDRLPVYLWVLCAPLTFKINFLNCIHFESLIQDGRRQALYTCTTSVLFYILLATSIVDHLFKNACLLNTSLLSRRVITFVHQQQKTPTPPNPTTAGDGNYRFKPFLTHGHIDHFPSIFAQRVRVPSGNGLFSSCFNGPCFHIV